ncbi:hypothetical protein [Desulfocurvus vexinensis]|uniref:hypothetical protein n=1 Tax=Desulfocurvus vexinensis TaxID=399548 RepID=UPI000491FA5E|nr:hypothetical protein [Desulfocurvus vexinensis]
MQYIPKAIAADAGGVKTIGLERWREDFLWPVTNEQVLTFARFFLDQWAGAYEGLRGKDRDLLLASIGTCVWFFDHALAGGVRHYCRERGIALEYSTLAREIYEPDFAVLAAKPRESMRTLTAGRTRNVLRAAAKNVAFNRGAGAATIVRSVLGWTDTWGLGSATGFKRDYIRQRGLCCHHLYLSELFPTLPPRGAVSGDLREAAYAVLRAMADHAHAVWGGSVDVDAALGCWVGTLELLSGVYDTVRAMRRLPRTILLSEVGQPLHRAIVLAARRRGTRVVGFAHGTPVGNLLELFDSYVEFAQCDEFVCPTRAMSENFAKVHAMSPLGRLCPVTFDAVGTDRYQKLSADYRSRPPIRRVRSAMVMGYPLKAFLGPFIVEANFFSYQLEVQLHLLDQLREFDGEVIYKMHPDTEGESEGIFEGRCQRIVRTPFEQSADEAEAYIFTHIGTSTFGRAVCSNRPVILLQIEGNTWNPDVLPLLSRRCTLIPARFDERGRIRYDERMLMDALTREQPDIDYGYVERYFHV